MKEKDRQEFQQYAPSELGSFVSRNTSSYASEFAPDPMNLRDEALFRAGFKYDKDKQSYVKPPRSEAGSYYTDTSSEPSILPVKEESNPAFTPRLNLNISEPRRPSAAEIQQEIERTDAMAQQIHNLAGSNPEAGFI